MKPEEARIGQTLQHVTSDPFETNPHKIVIVDIKEGWFKYYFDFSPKSFHSSPLSYLEFYKIIKNPK